MIPGSSSIRVLSAHRNIGSGTQAIEAFRIAQRKEGGQGNRRCRCEGAKAQDTAADLLCFQWSPRKDIPQAR
jgi:hypothetical protein